jgi:hypothetical protein
MSNSQLKRERHKVLATEQAPPPSSTSRGHHHLQPRGSPEPHPQSGPVPAGCRSGHWQLTVL